MNNPLGSQKFTNPRVAQWLLRGGLAFVFLYAGFSGLREPMMWVGYMPPFLGSGDQAVMMVKLFSFVELLLALWLISGLYVRYAALLAVGMLAGITVFNLEALVITFRDVGLTAMAAALFFSEEQGSLWQKRS